MWYQRERERERRCIVAECDDDGPLWNESGGKTSPTREREEVRPLTTRGGKVNGVLNDDLR